MQTDRIDDDPTPEGTGNPDLEDAKTQAAVLACVLSEHPRQLTLTEISDELIGPEPRFFEHDEFERAVEDLIAAGLLRSVGKLRLPTRAALHFHRLELE